MNKIMYLLLFLIIGFFSYKKISGLEVKVGIPQKSASIKLAKKNGVFFKKYLPESDTIVLDDIKLVIDEIWVENNWFYKNTSEEIEKFNGYQLVMNFKHEVSFLTDIPQAIFIKNRYAGIGRNRLTFKIDTLESHETIHFVSNNRYTIRFEVFPEE